jgi:ABC-type spermidine/putrescine transport system permease subunit I
MTPHASSKSGPWLVRAIPFAWLLLFFALPFFIIVRLSL